MSQNANIEDRTDQTDINRQGSDASSIDNRQLLQVVKNMESVLGTVMFEIHKSREDQLQFKQEVNEKLGTMMLKQQNFVDTVTTLTRNLSINISNCIEQVDKCNKVSSLEQYSKTEKTLKEVHSEVTSLKKCLNTRLDGVRTFLHSVEACCTELKSNMELKSKDCKAEAEKIHSYSQQICEAVTEVKRETRRTHEQMTEVEKGIIALSETEKFTLPSKTAERSKQREPDIEHLTGAN